MTDIAKLSEHERRVFSQTGEDGVIARIFDVIGTTDKKFVEIGTGKGKQCNTRHLRESLDWSGAMVDKKKENLSINLHEVFVTQENVVEVLAKLGVLVGEFDFLSIDIDGNDWYVWRAIAKHYSPRVVCVEINPNFGDEDRVIAYNPEFGWNRHKHYRNFYGATPTAMVKLAKTLGYSLVYICSAINAFFVRNDLVLDRFGVVDDHRLFLANYQPIKRGCIGEWSTAEIELGKDA